VSNADTVWGVLFEVDRAEKPGLDRAEGLDHGYNEVEVSIETKNREVSALMYQATSKNIALKPYHWYTEFVVEGAQEHGLSRAYVGSLKSVISEADPDQERANRERAFLRKNLASSGWLSRFGRVVFGDVKGDTDETAR